MYLNLIQDPHYYCVNANGSKNECGCKWVLFVIIIIISVLKYYISTWKLRISSDSAWTVYPVLDLVVIYLFKICLSYNRVSACARDQPHALMDTQLHAPRPLHHLMIELAGPPPHFHCRCLRESSSEGWQEDNDVVVVMNRLLPVVNYNLVVNAVVELWMHRAQVSS